tara:strand:- start:8263 stop:11451 length:3189 start_codon:yes stop_codon:yes gene_type:complete
MPAGKKQYIISTTAYGLKLTARANRFKSAFALGEDTDYGIHIYSKQKRDAILQHYKSLHRDDQFLIDPEVKLTVGTHIAGIGTADQRDVDLLGALPQKAEVDPIRVFANRLWSEHTEIGTVVQTAGGATNQVKSVKFLSGSMNREVDNTPYDSIPFDIVFSDHTPKTGEGTISQGAETLMLSWRDSHRTVRGSAGTSGLFPVYQENIKLVPIASCFNAYYTNVCGLDSDRMTEMQTFLETDEGKQMAISMGIDPGNWLHQGSMYMWNLMRAYIGEFTLQAAGAGRDYEDYSSYTQAPFNRQESKALAHTRPSAHAWAASEYNFYSQLYEKYSRHCPELLLPCLMVQSAAETSMGDPTTSPVAQNNASLGGAIKSAVTGKLKGKTTKKDMDAKETMELSSMYWAQWGQILAKVVRGYDAQSGNQLAGRQLSDADLADTNLARDVLRKIYTFAPLAARASGYMKNMCFSGDYRSIIKDAGQQRENYPMHAEISFTADHFAQFSDHINTAGLMPTLIDSLIASQPGNQTLTQEINRSDKPVIGLQKAVFEAAPKMTMHLRDDGGTSIGQRYSINPMNRVVLDVEMWLQSVLNNRQNTAEMTGRLHCHAATISGKGMTNTLEQQIKTIIAMGKIKDMVTDYLRSYSKILKGELGYSEVVVYQVRKTDKDGKEIQSFWFANSSDITDIDFVDTQVRYGHTYGYDIYAYTLVIGTRYNIGNNTLDMSTIIKSPTNLHNRIKQNDPLTKNMAWSDATYSQQCWYTPSLKIVKTRIHAEKVIMFDTAPVVPEFELVPYKGIDHKLLLIFKGSVGRQKMNPVHIGSTMARYGPKWNQTEQQAAANQYEYQTHEILDGDALLYESDDRPEFFEIYRTKEAPYSYEDFDGALYAVVQTRIPSEKETYPANNILPKYSDAATMIDLVMPNTKYYYTIRQVDVHGNVSNPTAVFQAEIVNENGTIYPLISEYHFKDRVPRTNKKYFNKHIKIAPTPAQVLIKSDGMTSAFDAANGNVQLGLSDTNVWGKKFKVRITSTTTGKSADLNLEFNQKHERTADEIERKETADKEAGAGT